MDVCADLAHFDASPDGRQCDRKHGIRLLFEIDIDWGELILVGVLSRRLMKSGKQFVERFGRLLMKVCWGERGGGRSRCLCSSSFSRKR